MFRVFLWFRVQRKFLCVIQRSINFDSFAVFVGWRPALLVKFPEKSRNQMNSASALKRELSCVQGSSYL